MATNQRGLMSTSDEKFNISGPLHLLTTPFDWENTCHRRSLAASLVRGVYVLERDREQGRIGQDCNAPPWWEHFHFELYEKLKDESDGSYFGAIFKLKQTRLLPRYVIAFRGTMMGYSTISADMSLNLKYYSTLDKIEENPRFRTAFEAVLETVSMEGVGPTKVWIAGHSLGASIAMVIGRNMAKSGYQLETYLFNPPFFTITKMIKSEKLKNGIRFAGSLVKAGLAKALNRHGEDPFTLLSAWKPCLFVNPSDFICAEYIGYFEHREKMEGIGGGRIERIATRYSMKSLFSGARSGRKAEAYHLVPTAYMTENISPPELFKQAHGIHQWWQDHSQWKTKLYEFK